MSDIDPDVITRPDIPAALVSEDEGRSSGFHQRVERVLAPYTAVPVLTSRLNEPTVPDAALRISMAKARLAEEHTPSQPSVPPLSGTRAQVASTVPPPLVASTVPPPQRARTQRPTTPVPTHTQRPVTPVPTHTQRPATPVPTRTQRPVTPVPTRTQRPVTPVPTRATEGTPARLSAPPSAVPPPVRESHLRAYLLIAFTAVSAAAVGAGLGNGSLVSFGIRLQHAFIDGDTPAPLVSTQHARPHASSAVPMGAKAPAPSPRAATPVEDAPKVPLVRLDQLPPPEPEAEPADAEPADAKRTDAKRAEPKRLDPRSAEAKRAHQASRR